MTLKRTSITTWLAITLATLPKLAVAQQFEPTAGAFQWNDNNNWGPSPPQPFPNATGASATIAAPTGDLSIDLGQTITLGSLTINKSTTVTFPTTITATAPDGFIFEGGGTIATRASFAGGGGATTVAAPISTNGLLTVTQGDDGLLRLSGDISGTGAVRVQRTADGTQDVAFAGNNSYSGVTTIAGNASTTYTVLRLESANAIPGGLDVAGGASNITLTNSGILGLGATDFKRAIGTGPNQIQFSSPVNSGFAAYGGDRVVNLGGASATISWATAGFGTLTFGTDTSDGTIDFQNPLNFGNTNRSIRVADGTAPDDAKLTGTITSTGAANSFTKLGGGALRLTVANSYTGNTFISGGTLRIAHPQALPANTNISLSNGGILGLGVADYNATIGTGPAQIQFTTTSNNSNAGFSASGGNRTVTLNGGAPLVWGTTATPTFVIGNFLLAEEGADSTVTFTNALDLNNADRTFAVRNGTADIDGRVTGVISGSGGIVKGQAGTFETSAANTYTGNTRVQSGVLLLTNVNSIPGGTLGGSTGNITLAGGALGLGATDFTAPLGSGPGQVQFESGSNGGFAAYGADRIVNLGGASAPVVWDSGGFVSANFQLGAGGADKTLTFQNPIDLNGAVRVAAVREGYANIDAILTGVITGTGSGLQKTQGGTLSLTAANTYDGGTGIDAGRLLANNTTGSAVGSGDVTVTDDGILGGNGFVGTAGDASNVVVNALGHIAPGTSTGKLTVNGNVTWEADSFLDVELGGTTAGVDYDQLVVNGAATLAGTLQLQLINSFAPAVGQSFDILDWTSLSGTFESLSLPTLSAGLAWDTAQLYSSGVVSVVSAPGLPGDYNNDGAVNAADYVVWRHSLGTNNTLPNDFTPGTVTQDDYQVWRGNFGAPAAGIGAAATVPEPTSLVPLFIGTAIIAVRNRRLPRSKRAVSIDRTHQRTELSVPRLS